MMPSDVQALLSCSTTVNELLARDSRPATEDVEINVRVLSTTDQGTGLEGAVDGTLGVECTRLFLHTWID